MVGRTAGILGCVVRHGSEHKILKSYCDGCYVTPSHCNVPPIRTSWDITMRWCDIAAVTIGFENLMFRTVSYNTPQYSSRTTHHLYSSFLETHNVRIGCTYRWDITMRWCDIAAVTIGFENLMFRTVSYNTPQYSSRTTHHLYSFFLETHNVRIGCTHRWDITMRWCEIAAVTIGFENLVFRTVSYNTPQYSSRTTHHLYSSFLETHNVRIGCTYRWDITMRWCDIAAVTIGFENLMFRTVSYNTPQYSSRTTHHLYFFFLETHNVRIGCTYRWDITMRWCEIAAVTIGFENLMFRTVSYNTPQYSSRTTHHLYSSFLETHNVRIGCTYRWDITMRWCEIAAVTIGFENLVFRTVSYNTPQYSSRTTHHLYFFFLETHNVRIGCTHRWDITMRWCEIAAVTIGFENLMFRTVSYNTPQYSSRTTHHLYSPFLETHNVRIGCTHRWDITMRWCEIAAVTIGFENLMFRTVSYNTPQYSSRTTHHLYSSFLETHNVRIGCTHRWDITMRWCDIAAVTIGFENLMFRTVSYNTPQYSSRTTHHLYSSFLETHNVRIGCIGGTLQ